jgi:uncharacterized LabA/DUF88 family protein
MASIQDNISMAVFCDFENVALGVRDAKYDKFDIRPVLERLLLKGSIVLKKAYCDWDRYKTFKPAMHEASFELIEIPHIRQSGKNSADIRLVVDALDLCYTKSHVNTFVIISGDSDFSPLVSKLRENAKQVIGVGVKQSTSDLLIGNCDEFIFYDDLVRESQRSRVEQQDSKAMQLAARAPSQAEKSGGKEELESRKRKAIETAVETFDALVSERGDSGKIWASTLKQAIKRRRPGFNEAYYGFRAFGNLLEEAQERGLLELGRDEKSGTYIYRSDNGNTGKSSAHAETSVTGHTMQSSIQLPVQPAPDPDPASGHEPLHRRHMGHRPEKKTAEPLPPPAPAEAGMAARRGVESASPSYEPGMLPEDTAGKAVDKTTGKGRKPAPRKRRPSRAEIPDTPGDQQIQEIPGIPEEAQNDNGSP